MAGDVHLGGALVHDDPYTTSIFAGLLALGAIALLFADRTTRPILERVSTDLSEHE